MLRLCLAFLVRMSVATAVLWRVKLVRTCQLHYKSLICYEVTFSHQRIATTTASQMRLIRLLLGRLETIGRRPASVMFDRLQTLIV